MRFLLEKIFLTSTLLGRTAGFSTVPTRSQTVPCSSTGRSPKPVSKSGHAGLIRRRGVGPSEEEPQVDESLLAGDLALLVNNVFGLDVYVTSQRATKGEGVFQCLSYAFHHSFASLNHASALVACWLLAGLITKGFQQNSENIGTDVDAAKLAAAIWAVHVPLMAVYYYVGSSGVIAGWGEPERFGAGLFFVELYFNLIFLAAWRIVYRRWSAGGFF